MAFACRAHGATTHDEVTGKLTGWPSWGKLGCKVLFTLSFGGVNYLLFGIWWLALIAAAFNVFFLTTGHGRWFAMNGANLNDPNPEWIEKYIASWLYKGDITKPRYSWFCFGVKGLLLGIGALPLALALAYLWPASYAWSWKHKNTSEYAEYLTGGFAGLVVLLTIVVYIIISL